MWVKNKLIRTWVLTTLYLFECRLTWTSSISSQLNSIDMFTTILNNASLLIEFLNSMKNTFSSLSGFNITNFTSLPSRNIIYCHSCFICVIREYTGLVFNHWFYSIWVSSALFFLYYSQFHSMFLIKSTFKRTHCTLNINFSCIQFLYSLHFLYF